MVRDANFKIKWLSRKVLHIGYFHFVRMNLFHVGIFFIFLAPYSEYNVTLRVKTKNGDGEAVSILGRTNESSNLLSIETFKGIWQYIFILAYQ